MIILYVVGANSSTTLTAPLQQRQRRNASHFGLVKWLMLNVKLIFTNHLPFTIYRLPFTVYHLPFTIYHLPFTIYHLPFTIYQSLFKPLRILDIILCRAGDKKLSIVRIKFFQLAGGCAGVYPA